MFERCPWVQFGETHATVSRMNTKEMTEQQALLTVRGLTCERGGNELFAGMTFSVNSGDLVQIEGSNGSGKSTLLRCLCGFYKGWEGEINWYIDHHPLYIGHKAGVSADLSIEENLAYLLALHEIPQLPQLIEGVVADAGLLVYLNRAVRDLSEGQRKKVNLCRLGLLPSQIWLLDEPFSSLDGVAVDWLMSMIEDHRANGGSVVYTSHQAIKLDQKRVRLADFVSKTIGACSP